MSRPRGKHGAVAARISAIQANKRLVSERSRNGKEKRRLLASFADTSTKPVTSGEGLSQWLIYMLNTALLES